MELGLIQLYIFRTGDTCKKCNERRAEVVLRLRDAYCRFVSVPPKALSYIEQLT